LVDQAEIHRKSLSEKVEDRIEAVDQLNTNFTTLPDKDTAWRDLHRLIEDKESCVRWMVARALGDVFRQVPDRASAWQDLYRLYSNEDHNYVRRMAAYALSTAFPHIPDKNSVWQDLHRLSCDEDEGVRWGATHALRDGFPYFTDRASAWQDLHRLSCDENEGVRWGAANALGVAFPHVPDKDSAWQELHRLSCDEDCHVRIGAVCALGSAFPHIPDKGGALEAMFDLSGDDDDYVRLSANHSLGKASIFKATDAEGEWDFRRELESALEYFKKSAAGFDTAKFCLLFYRSFQIIAFKESYSETELNGYLDEAKNIAKGSKNRIRLLEIIEHISQAQKEAQSAEEMNLDAMKCYLNIYRKHCEPASDLLRSAEEKSPIATKLIRRRTPIFDQKIRETIKLVLDAVEAKHVPESELQGTLDAMQQTLSEIQQQNVALHENLKLDVKSLRKVIDDPKREVADKLKLTIPIIPQILSYERVVELKSGMNLCAAWRALVNSARRRR